ncbi:hypothetical protein PS2_030504 [Malus domestica]
MSTILRSQPSTPPPPLLLGGIPSPPLPAGETPSPPLPAGGIPSPPLSPLEEEEEMGILALPLKVEHKNTIGHQKLTSKSDIQTTFQENQYTQANNIWQHGETSYTSEQS